MSEIGQFTGKVEEIPVGQIEPSPENPRGKVTYDESFQRLVSSVKEVGVLVPIVVKKIGESKYQLVDGERRFRAAKQIRSAKGIPAHVITSDVDKLTLRKYMFHLHMTREQWEPLAQCKALQEMYPEIENGISLRQKNEWTKKIKATTWMDGRTARDRIHVLAWPSKLKKEIEKFDDDNPDRDIYSYVLAIEASIVEPEARSTKRFDEDRTDLDKEANSIRKALLQKTFHAIQNGHVTSRDQIRVVEPLFKSRVKPENSKVARKIFDKLLEKPDYFFDDAAAEMEDKLPELSLETPPKPMKLLANIRQLADSLAVYDISYIDSNSKAGTQRAALHKDLKKALLHLIGAAQRLRGLLS